LTDDDRHGYGIIAEVAERTGEQGVAMLASVLRSPRAVAVNIEIMRAFVQLRRVLSAHADLARKIQDLEKRYDGQFRAVFDTIRDLMQVP
jgi:hypothetical protein